MTLFWTLPICFLGTFLIATGSARTASLATASNDYVTHCTGHHAWLAPGFLIEHCLEAADRLEYSDYAVYTAQRFEFSNLGTRRTSHFPKMTTPRRYTISTCSIFVAMLWNFPQQRPLPPLPGMDLPPGQFEKSQVTSFREIYVTTKRIVYNCYGRPETPVGWQTVDTNGNIGVFVMATHSLVAQNIHAAVYKDAGMQYLQNLTKPHGNFTALL